MARSRNRLAKVFPSDGTFRVIRYTSLEDAELNVRLEVLCPEFDQLSGAHLGYRMTGLDKAVDQDLMPMFTTACISARDMECNALDRSHTKGLSEIHRLERMVNGKAPEDRAERVQAKVRVYAVIGPARGDILRVWPK